MMQCTARKQVWLGIKTILPELQRLDIDYTNENAEVWIVNSITNIK